MDKILHRLADGTVEVRENFDLKPFGTEDDRNKFIMAMTEAESNGKSTRLEAKIAAMPEGVTRNKTFYPIEALEASISSWTNPYPCPVIKDHNEYEIDNIVGRISEAYIAPDGASSALWFNVGILDKEAQEKVADGTWAQVSIGTRVGSAKCSICGNDWADGTWCDHERGSYYLKDENKPESVSECFWIMGEITGREVSFVVTPSAASAGVRSIKQVAASEAEIADERLIYSMALMKADESELGQLRAVEYFGSPASNGEANVPSIKKEESMEPVVKTEDTEVVETEVLSDASMNEEGSAEGTETEDVVVDGPASEDSDEGKSSSEEDTDDAEAAVVFEDPVGSEETTSEDEGDSTPSESDEAAETAPAVEEPVADESDDEIYTNEERASHLSRIAVLESEVLTLKAQVYVESGLRDGTLAGEHDALVDEHAVLSESTLDELLTSVIKRRAMIGTSEMILSRKLESPIQRIDDDKNADKDRDNVVVHVRTRSGSQSVNVETDDTPVTVTPKF